MNNNFAHNSGIKSYNSSRYSLMFSQLARQQEIAWIPFLMLGYPDMETSINYIQLFIDNGADALEIGIPFSDPVADGTVIQESAQIALANGTTVKKCFDAIAKIRQKNPQIPIGLLTYANLVFRPGLSNFYNHCHEVGIDSVLIADVPLLESKVFINEATKAQVDAVFIAPPNASSSVIKRLSQLSGGYTYVVSRPGVTGDNNEVAYPEKIAKQLLKNQAPPPVLGFGISQPEHVIKAANYGFKGVISGSAITRMIANNLPSLKEQLIEFSRTMKASSESFI